MQNLLCLVFYLSIFVFAVVTGQLYEDQRCRCVCPSLAAVLNNTVSSDRKLYIANVPPNRCNCDGVILPRVGGVLLGREQEYCPRCDCKYESRNTAVIKVVVIIVIWVVALLLVYMGFFMCLEPLRSKRRPKLYQEIGTDEARILLQGEED